MKQFYIYTFTTALILLNIFLYPGCDDSGIMTEEPPPYDSTLINYNDRILNERVPLFDTVFSSIDLFTGIVERDISTKKDAVLVDSAGMSYNFYLRSGDMSIDAPGYQTRFKQFVYTNLTQNAFDTVSVIPDSDTTLNENDFTSDDTPYFNEPLQNHSVYGFYLKGKYIGGVTSKPVYGMIYLDSAWRESGNLKLRIDVKINVDGKNKFRTPTP